MTRTLFSFIQRMTRIPIIEVDIEVSFEQGQNIHIFFLGNFFLGGGGGAKFGSIVGFFICSPLKEYGYNVLYLLVDLFVSRPSVIHTVS